MCLRQHSLCPCTSPSQSLLLLIRTASNSEDRPSRTRGGFTAAVACPCMEAVPLDAVWHSPRAARPRLGFPWLLPSRVLAGSSVPAAGGIRKPRCCIPAALPARGPGGRPHGSARKRCRLHQAGTGLLSRAAGAKGRAAGGGGGGSAPVWPHAAHPPHGAAPCPGGAEQRAPRACVCACEHGAVGPLLVARFYAELFVNMS